MTGDDLREGLTAVISVKLPQPEFEGQTKTKLGNSEVRGIVEKEVGDMLSAYFEQNPAVIKRIVGKSIAAALRAKVWPMFADGRLKTQTHKVFPFSEAAAAHEMMEKAAHRGKILLAPRT